MVPPGDAASLLVDAPAVRAPWYVHPSAKALSRSYCSCCRRRSSLVLPPVNCRPRHCLARQLRCWRVPRRLPSEVHFMFIVGFRLVEAPTCQLPLPSSVPGRVHGETSKRVTSDGVAAAAPGVQVCRMAGLPERAQGRTKQQRSRLHGPPHWRCEWLTRLVYSEITRSSHRLFAPGKMDLLRVRPVFRLTINPRAQPTCTCCRCARSAGSRRSGVPSALFLF